jgi:hypothetical protein
MTLARAQLQAASGTVRLDFNPETLTIRVTNKLEEPKHVGAEKRQVTGSGSRTLSFEAVFDGTSPSGGGGLGDVTARTAKISRMLYPGNDPTAVPERVTFLWGTLVFTGVIEELSETLDYFDEAGTPLRSRLSISIREQELAQSVAGGSGTQPRPQGGAPSPGNPGTVNPPAPSQSDPTASSLDGLSLAGGPLGTTLGALGASINQAESVARQNGLDSLLQIARTSGLVFDPAADGTPARPTAPAAPGARLSGAETLALFGRDAVGGLGAAADLGAIAGLQPQTAARPRTPGAQPPWAPAGPAAGSAAAANARVAQQGRASGPVAPGAAPAAPIAGSPPVAALLAVAPRPVVFAAEAAAAARCERSAAPWKEVRGAPRPSSSCGSCDEEDR